MGEIEDAVEAAKRKLGVESVSDEANRDGRDPDTGRFVKGNPGGPGRPSLAGEILKVLSENDARTGKPNVHQVAVATVELAKKGSIGHVNLIIERTDGKVSQPIDATLTQPIIDDIPRQYPDAED